MRTLKLVIVSSTGGSVMNALLGNAFFRSQVFSVVSDRACPAIEKAAAHGVSTEVFRERNTAEFCNRLLACLKANEADYVISFYTRLFVGDLVRQYADRIINLHPSILPAFKGLDGFGDTLRGGTRYCGTTIHFIDERMDEGKIILQSVCPVDPDRAETELRHRIFQQQCKSLLQVVRWLAEDRVRVKAGRVLIERARFQDLEFSPNLDFVDAINLAI